MRPLRPSHHHLVTHKYLSVPDTTAVAAFLIAAILNEGINLNVRAQLQGRHVSFTYNKCIRQGSVEAAKRFNPMVLDVVSPLVNFGSRKGMVWTLARSRLR